MPDSTDLTSHAGINLDIGCGSTKQAGPGWVGVDHRPLPGVDVVHDLWTFPWPFADNSVNLALMSHYWEHVPPWLTFKTMAEIHRICRHGAQVLIAGPYGLGYRYQMDPTHCNPTVESSFAYWDPTLPRFASKNHPVKGKFWRIYEPPILHLMSFARVPAGGDADFNACLVVCKDKTSCIYCDGNDPMTPSDIKEFNRLQAKLGNAPIADPGEAAGTAEIVVPLTPSTPSEIKHLGAEVGENIYGA